MGGVKKSVYVFLCSLLGVLLFLILHRIIVLGYLFLVIYGVFHWTSNYSYMEFVAIDYVTLLLVLLCGSWYGIWLGNYWYEQVYELQVWPGTWRRLRHSLLPARSGNADLKQKVEAAKQQITEDLSNTEQLVQEFPQEIIKPVAIKRKITRKKPAMPRMRSAKQLEE